MANISLRVALAAVSVIAIGTVAWRFAKTAPTPEPADNSATERAAAAPTERTEPVAIDPGVNDVYTREAGYEKFFDMWGDDGMARVERTRRGAAEIAARSLECDHVELSELSQQRSAYPSRIVVFVDCTNRKRFYISEDEVIAAGY